MLAKRTRSLGVDGPGRPFPMLMLAILAIFAGVARGDEPASSSTAFALPAGAPPLFLVDSQFDDWRTRILRLDAATGARVISIMTELNEESGTTMVLVTHDADLAAKAHRVIRLADGSVVSDSGNGSDPA